MTKYAVLIESSYHVEGDERSRTNPGHGYPAHDVSYTSIEKFGNIAELTRWVEAEEAKTYGKRKYTVIQYTELQVNRNVSITFQKE